MPRPLGGAQVLKYRVIVFDFDGTLADSFPFLVSVANTLADRFGFRRIAESEIATLRTYDTRRLLRHVGLPLWKVPLLAASFRTLMSERIQEIGQKIGIALLTLLMFFALFNDLQRLFVG